MKIIAEANDSVIKILDRLKNSGGSRLLRYCVTEQTEDGILLFNLLTREMVLLSEEEYGNLPELNYLKNRWFVVPEKSKDKEYADLVKWVLSTRKKKSEHITNYTIFTTTDCNARCYYCFELGRSRMPMSKDTAKKVVQYIKAHCGNEMAKLRWFGGEPLFNQDVIDIICDGLREEGISFNSTAVSNGYLFNEATVQKAYNKWNLKGVQITLDGTEIIYNKTKAYIYREGNPYQKVLNNIGHLLDTGILVHVRLNMDLHNAVDMLSLVEELDEKFRGKSGLRIYAHHLFSGTDSMAELHSDEEWRKRFDAMCRLNEKIAHLGLASIQGISKGIKLNHCMADSGNGVTILPGGEIGLCGEHSDSEFIGHIDAAGFDKAVVRSWKETVPPIPECAECFYYPECIKLIKCGNTSVCFHFDREEKLLKTRRRMKMTYTRWKNNVSSQAEDDDIGC